MGTKNLKIFQFNGVAQGSGPSGMRANHGTRDNSIRHETFFKKTRSFEMLK